MNKAVITEIQEPNLCAGSFSGTSLYELNVLECRNWHPMPNILKYTSKRRKQKAHEESAQPLTYEHDPKKVAPTIASCTNVAVGKRALI